MADVAKKSAYRKATKAFAKRGMDANGSSG
jgi:hypothetical protein